MEFSRRIDELRMLLEGKEPEEDTDNTIEWTADDGYYFAAVLVNELGEWAIENPVLDEDEDYTVEEGFEHDVTPEELEKRLYDLFNPPKFVREAPFKDSVTWWWKAVANALRAGRGVIVDKNGVPRPNYGEVVSRWKDYIGDEYGWRPKRTKEKSMTQEIHDRLTDAARTLGKYRAGHKIDPSVVSRAAKLLASHSVKKRRGS